MSWLSDFIRKLRGKAPKNPQPETPPVAVPQPVYPPVTPPPVAVAPTPVTPAPTPVTPTPPPQAATPMPGMPVMTRQGFFEPDGRNYTLNPPPPPAGMVYPAVGVWFNPGTTTPVPVFSLVPIPKNEVRLTWGATDPYPKIVRVDGVNILAKAPINPAWKASLSSHTFGGANHPNGDPRSFVWDPSNAPNGYALRSPNGYPLFYAGVHWDAAADAWVVSPGQTIGTPTIIFGEHNGFKDEAEIATYVTASADRDEALRRWQVEFSKTYYLGPVKASTLSQIDRGWLYGMSMSYRMSNVHNGDLHRTILEGYNLDISRAINDGDLVYIQYHGNVPQPDGPQAALLVSTVQQAFAAAAAGTPMVPRSEVR